MIRVFVNWLTRRRIRRSRATFRFFDGRRWRYVDPIATLRTLHESETFSLETTLSELDSPDNTISLAAIGITADAVRDAFDAPKYADGGLTESELLTLISTFVRYLAALKKNSST